MLASAQPRDWQRRGETTTFVASGQPSGHGPNLSTSLSNVKNAFGIRWTSLGPFLAEM